MPTARHPARHGGGRRTTHQHHPHLRFMFHSIRSCSTLNKGVLLLLSTCRYCIECGNASRRVTHTQLAVCRKLFICGFTIHADVRRARRSCRSPRRWPALRSAARRARSDTCRRDRRAYPRTSPGAGSRRRASPSSAHALLVWMPPPKCRCAQLPPSQLAPLLLQAVLQL